MELYVLIAVLVSIICYLFARDDNKNKLIRDLYERLAAKDRDEYMQNTGQQHEHRYHHNGVVPMYRVYFHPQQPLRL